MREASNKPERRGTPRRVWFCRVFVFLALIIFLILIVLEIGILLHAGVQSDGQTGEVSEQTGGNETRRRNFASSRSEEETEEERETETEPEPEEEIPDILTLVNKTHRIPSDWTVDLVELDNEQSIDRRAYEGLKSMIEDAEALGLDPLICSSYRSTEKQTSLYEEKVSYFIDRGCSRTLARDLAAEYVSVPGTSEHQLGLAVDICSESYQVLETDQADTPVQQWLMANCYHYGFILRYPEGKTDVTGVSFEPWHYRYVGVEAATEIYEKGYCLEEYLGIE